MGGIESIFISNNYLINCQTLIPTQNQLGTKLVLASNSTPTQRKSNKVKAPSYSVIQQVYEVIVVDLVDHEDQLAKVKNINGLDITWLINR